MRPTDQVQVVTVEELADHIGTKGEGDSSIILPPALHVFVWIRPQQVAQQACNKAVKMRSSIEYTAKYSF